MKTGVIQVPISLAFGNTSDPFDTVEKHNNTDELIPRIHTTSISRRIGEMTGGGGIRRVTW